MEEQKNGKKDIEECLHSSDILIIPVRCSEFYQLNRGDPTETEIFLLLLVGVEIELLCMIMTTAIWNKNIQQLRWSRKGSRQLIWGMFKGRIWERLVQKTKSRSLRAKLWIGYKNFTQDIYLKLFLSCWLSLLNVQLTLVEISVSNKLTINPSLFGDY